MQEDITLLQRAYQAYEIPSEVQDFIWETVANFCFSQLETRKGPFFDAAHRAGFLVDIPRSPDALAPVATKPTTRRRRS